MSPSRSGSAPSTHVVTAGPPGAERLDAEVGDLTRRRSIEVRRPRGRCGCSRRTRCPAGVLRVGDDGQLDRAVRRGRAHDAHRRRRRACRGRARCTSKRGASSGRCARATATPRRPDRIRRGCGRPRGADCTRRSGDPAGAGASPLHTVQRERAVPAGAVAMAGTAASASGGSPPSGSGSSGVGGIGSHDTPGPAGPDAEGRARRRGRRAGSTTPSRARADERRVDARERRRDPGDLVLDLVDGLEVEVGAEAGRELAGDPPGLHRRALGRDLAGRGAARGLRGWSSCRAARPTPWAGARRRRARSRRRGTRRRRRSARPSTAPLVRARGRGSRRAGRTRAARAPSPAGRGGPQDAGGVEARRVGHAPHASATVLPAGVERDPSGEEPGRQAEVERAVDVAAAQRREEPDVGVRAASSDAACTVASADSATDGRPSTTTTGPSRSSSASTSSSIALVRVLRPPSAVDELRDDVARSHRAAWRRTVVAYRRQTGLARADVDERDTEVDGRAPHAQVEHRQLLLEVGAEQHDRLRAVEVGDRGARHPEHDLGRAGRRRAGRRRGRCRCTPLARRAQAYASSFVPACATEHRDRAGTGLVAARGGSWSAAASSASGHDALDQLRHPCARIGARTRVSACTHS